MPATNLPNALSRLGHALAKHYVKNLIGDEALEVLSTTLTDIGGEILQVKVDSILASKDGEKQLLKAAKAADKKFIKICKDKDLRDLFTMDHGDLPSVQTAIANMPKELDDEALHETLFKVFRSELPERVSDEQVNKGVNLYVKCLRDALLPVKDFGVHILHNELKEINKGVEDVNRKVDFLVEKAKASSQSAADSKNPYARFLVPFPHNNDFFGREAELASLHEMLQQKQSIVGIRPTVLVGLGGIGKTQLAVEYAHKYREQYPSGVFWLNAINPLLFEFSDLAEKLDMANRDTPRDKAARKAWEYLDSHPNALVIFDNVLEPSGLNVPFSPDLVPANLRCRTLFTTRQRDFPRTFQPFEVKILPENAAMKLLLRSRPEVLELHHPEWGWARIICAELGWLPLALELAAAYLGTYPEVSVTGYLERLRTEGSLETVDKSEVRAVDLPTRVEESLKAAAAGNLEVKHQVAVSATLQTQWKRMDDEDAKLLFRAAGQFPEASWIPIPRLGLLTGFKSEAKAGHPSPLSVVLKKLHTVSLIEELTDTHLRLHPLVREFAGNLSAEPAMLRLDLADNLANALVDMVTLEIQVRKRGLDEVLEDLSIAMDWLRGQKTGQETHRKLSDLRSVLDREAHHIRVWEPDRWPYSFHQQLAWRAHAMGRLTLAKDAEKILEERGHPYLNWQWGTLRDNLALRILEGHEGMINDVALSEDGRLAISASEDRTLRVWDVVSGRLIREIPGRQKGFTGVAITTDGRAVSAAWYSPLEIWNLETGELVQMLEVNQYKISKLAFNEGLDRVISLSNLGELQVWELSKDKNPATLQKSRDNIKAVSLSRNGDFAAVALDDGTLQLWDIKSRKSFKVDGLKDTITALAVTDDGQRIVAACQNKQLPWLRVWNKESGWSPNYLRGHTSFIENLSLTTDGFRAISSSDDGTLRVWDVENQIMLGILYGHHDVVDDVALSADGLLAVSASRDKTLRVWGLESLDEAKREAGHTISIDVLRILPGGKNVVSASSDRSARIWDMENGEELWDLKGHNKEIRDIVLSSDGRLLVSASADATVQIWDLDSKKDPLILKGHTEGVNKIVIGEGRRSVISASDDQTLRVWNIDTGKTTTILKGHTAAVTSLAITPDEQWVISGSLDGTLRVWDLTNDSQKLLDGNAGSIESLFITSTGQQVATISGTYDSSHLHLWNLEQGQLQTKVDFPYFAPKGKLRPPVVALTKEKKKVILGQTDGAVVIFDLETSEEAFLYGHAKGITSVALSDDGKNIFTASLDGTLRVWSLNDKDEIIKFDIEKANSLATYGNQLVVGESNGSIFCLQLKTNSMEVTRK